MKSILFISIFLLSITSLTQTTYGQSNSECKTCPKDTGQADGLTKAFQQAADNSNLNLNPAAELSEIEKDKLKKATKEYKDTFSGFKKEFYSKQYTLFNQCLEKYNDTYKGSSYQQMVNWIVNPIQKDVDYCNKNNNELKICHVNRECRTKPWVTDASLAGILNSQLGKSTADRDEFFLKQSQTELPKDIDARLEMLYKNKKQVEIGEKTKSALSTGSKYKFNPKDLDLHFSIDRLTTSADEPRSPEFQKLKNVNSVVKSVQSARMADIKKPLVCLPITLEDVAVKTVSTVAKSATQNTENLLPLPAPSPEPCDLKQNFAANESILNTDAKANLKTCVDAAKAKCANGIDYMHVEIKSCASTLRTDPKDLLNINLAANRYKSMEREFVANAQGISSYEITGNDDEDKRGYQNLDDDGQPTGTCGVAPPDRFGVEQWMHPGVCASSSTAGKRLTKAECDKRPEEYNSSNAWKCVPDEDEIRNATDTNDKVKKLYFENQKVELNMNYRCKAPPPAEIKTAIDPATTTTLPLACGIGVLCYGATVSLYPIDKNETPKKTRTSVTYHGTSNSKASSGCPGSSF